MAIHIEVNPAEREECSVRRMKYCRWPHVLYNRGARIIAGMPTGFYEGYSEEIHEVFVYDIVENN